MSPFTLQWAMCRNTIEVDTVAGARTWASGAGPALSATIARMQAGSHYGAHLVDLQKSNGTFIQTYACRPIRGSSAHSEHSHPVAMDLWPGANPMSNSGLLVTNFDLFGGTDGEAFLHSIMDPLPGVGRGIWQWGGGLYSADIATAIGCFRRRGHKITNSRVDAMHFELDDWVTASFVGQYAWGNWGLEDFMTPDDKAWLTTQFSQVDSALADLTKRVHGLEDSAKRQDDFLQGVATADTHAASAGNSDLQRGGFRTVRAANKTLGLDPGPGK